MYVYIYTYIYIIHIHVFRPAQDSSVVWLGKLTSREQLMSPECSKHQSPVFLVWFEQEDSHQK